MPSKRKGRPKGSLIALEGARGPWLNPTAQELARSLAKDEDSGGFSPFDASNIFYEMRLGKAKKMAPSARTLLLLFASDLAFRLRWQIRPALDEGMVVVAAPYVESAMAFGTAAGLPTKWMSELFSFAPKAKVTYRLHEDRKPPKEKQKAGEGFLEFCCSMLKHGSPPSNPNEIRKRFLEYLEKKVKQTCRMGFSPPPDFSPAKQGVTAD